MVSLFSIFSTFFLQEIKNTWKKQILFSTFHFCTRNEENKRKKRESIEGGKSYWLKYCKHVFSHLYIWGNSHLLFWTYHTHFFFQHYCCLRKYNNQLTNIKKKKKMGRSPCCDKTGLKKGPWTQEEDLKLTQYIEIHGPGNWRTLPKNAGKCYILSCSIIFYLFYFFSCYMFIEF